VKHIIVCGHYDCGGIKAAMEKNHLGSPLDNWLRNIRDVRRIHFEELEAIKDHKKKVRRLIELNVTE
jgi:carbonic anhydrase